jgi:hypothetical protein
LELKRYYLVDGRLISCGFEHGKLSGDDGGSEIAKDEGDFPCLILLLKADLSRRAGIDV